MTNAPSFPKADPTVYSIRGTVQIRVLISISRDTNQHIGKLIERHGGIILKYYEFIRTFAIEISRDSLDSLIVDPGVLFVRWSGNNDIYNRIIEAFDIVIGDKARYNIAVVNISLGPPQDQIHVPYDPINLAIKAATENSIVVVVAAGNSGPRNNTINPWSVGRDVIGVGAADSEGLAPYSSRGGPENPLYAPTVVAWGQASPIIGETEEDVRDMVGTSFAAPRVASIAIICLEFLESLHNHQKDQARKNVLSKSKAAAVIDIQIDPSRLTLPQKGSRVGIISESARTILLRTISFLDERKIQYSFETSPMRIKMMLLSMARPFINRQFYEVGAGYVDIDIAETYFRSFGAKSFCDLFVRRRLEPSELEELMVINNQFGPFMNEKEVKCIIDYCLSHTRIIGIDIGTSHYYINEPE